MKKYVRNRRTRMACAQRRQSFHGTMDPLKAFAAVSDTLVKSLKKFVEAFGCIKLQPWQRSILDGPLIFPSRPMPKPAQELTISRTKERPSNIDPDARYYFDYEAFSKDPNG